jgi:YHS domain-containing protein
MAQDPICGMNVDENKAAATAEYDGKRYLRTGMQGQV